MKEHLRPYFPQRYDKRLSFFDTLDRERHQIPCEMRLMRLVNDSNEIKLMIGALRKYGCNFNPSRHLACEVCHDVMGAFDPETSQIVINSKVNDTDALLQTIIHEMIHMFDFCRAKFDFNNLEHVACSEIRAANLTGCPISQKFFRGDAKFYELKGAHAGCVKDLAYQSLKAYSPEVESQKMMDIVEKVFPVCYRDLEPFGRRATGRYQDLKQSYRERYYHGYA